MNKFAHFKRFQIKRSLILPLLLCFLILIPVLASFFYRVSTTGMFLQEIIQSNTVEPSVPSGLETPFLTQQEVTIPFTGFIQNVGQLSAESIQYYYRSDELSVGFGTSSISFTKIFSEKLNEFDNPFDLAVPQVDVVEATIEFIGAQTVKPTGIDEKDHTMNFFHSNRKYPNIPSWNEVWYYDLYPNIDLRYYMSEFGLKYDFIVSSGGNPADIAIKVNGDVNLFLTEEEVTVSALDKQNVLVFQDVSLKVFQNDGKKIHATFEQNPSILNTYGFQVDNFDEKQSLIIDPVILGFSTYIGGGGFDHARKIAVGDDGSVYITGWTFSANFPTLNENQSFQGTDSDAFVVKINSSGVLIYSTYYGGSDSDRGFDIDVDDSGQCYITGYTYSNDLVMYNAYNDTYFGSGQDGFVAAFNTTGNGLIFSTYLGGEGEESAWGIAYNGDGIFVVGTTNSRNFPTKGAFQTTYNGGTDDGFVAWFNLTGNLEASSYLGGSGVDSLLGVSIFGKDSGLFVAGWTTSLNLPNATNNYNGGIDGYIASIALVGSTFDLSWTTYYGGTGEEGPYDIYYDNEYIYVTGQTSSSDFPLLNPYQDFYGGGIYDAFLIIIHPWAVEIIYSTYIGGVGMDLGRNIVLTPNNTIVIGGLTGSTDFPVLNAYSDTYGGGTRDGFIIGLKKDELNRLVYSTYFGSTGNDPISGIGGDSAGNLYVCGVITDSNLPTLNAYNSTYGDGGRDAYVAKFIPSGLSSDDIIPDIDLTDPNDGDVLQSDTIIHLDITDSGSGLRQALYRWDDGMNSSLSSPFNVTVPTSESTHRLHVYSQDIEGNWANAEYKFIVDDTPPQISVSGIADLSTVSGTMVISAEVTDTNGVDRVDFTQDGTTVLLSDDTPPYTTVWNSNSVGDGSHTLKVTALDLAGNEFSLTFTFTVKNAIEIDVGLAFGIVAAVAVPAAGILYWRSYGLRHRKVINLFLKQEISINEIANKTGKTSREVKLVLKKSKKYVD